MKSNLKYFFIIGVVILSCSQLVNKNKNSSSTTELAVNIPNHFEMTDEKLFEYAIKNKMGSCFIQDATKGTGFCQYYVKTETVAWSGKGWPVNPNTNDSTGCVSHICWPGYSPNMCQKTSHTKNHLLKNATAQLRDALTDPSNPCQIAQSKMR